MVAFVSLLCEQGKEKLPSFSQNSLAKQIET
jgi:hypothetical protein